MDEQKTFSSVAELPDAGAAKLEHFTSIIVADAMTESKAIYDEIRRETQDAMSAAEDEALAEAFRYIKTEMSKINTDCGRRLSMALMEKKRERHRLRDDMADKVFADVTKRLEDFTHGGDYLPYLKGLLSEILTAFGADTTVYLREEDAPLEAELGKLDTPYTLSFARGFFRLGGLAADCPSRKLHIDESFDGKMEELHNHFAALFGLKLDL